MEEKRQNFYRIERGLYLYHLRRPEFTELRRDRPTVYFPTRDSITLLYFILFFLLSLENCIQDLSCQF